MGEMADAILNGEFDSVTGEYLEGGPYGYPVTFTNRDGGCKASERNSKVRNFMKMRGITNQSSQKKALAEYCKHVDTDRPTFHACNNWAFFKEFIDKRVNYKSPSHHKPSNEIDKAYKELLILGFDVELTKDNAIVFEFNGGTVRYWPVKQWFSGKTVTDGRGFENLLNQLKAHKDGAE